MVSPTSDRRLGLVGNTAVKAPVAAVATANVTQSGVQSIDGVSLTSGMRVLCTAQTDAKTNGIWDVSTSAWTRSADADGTYDLASGSMVVISSGAHAYQVWILNTTDPISIGTSSLSWSMNTSATFLASLAASGGSSLIGFLQSGSGAVARTVQSKMREVVSLEDFGGIADWNGSTGTDNVTAFTDAKAALPAGGGVIRLGGGSYKTSTFTISGLQHITIEGIGSSQSSNAGAATEVVITTGSLVIDSAKCSLKHLAFRGGPAHAGDGVQVGHTVGGSVNGFSALDVGFYGFGRDGLRIGLDAGCNANNFSLTDCRSVSNGRIGYFISDNNTGGPVNANAGTITNCNGSFNGDDGIRYGYAFVNTQVGGVYELNTGCGARAVSGSNSNVILGGDFEGNSGTNQISIETTGAVFNKINVASLFFSSITDTGFRTQIDAYDNGNNGWYHQGAARTYMGNHGGANDLVCGSSSGGYMRMFHGDDTFIDANSQVTIRSTGIRLGRSSSGYVGFFDKGPIAKPTVTGGKGGNAALTSLLTSLANLGLITDSST